MRTTAEHVTAIARAATSERGRFTIALSGGDTPRSMYRLLATDEFARTIDWEQVHVFWGDERCVPPGDPASNYGMAKAALLGRVPLPPANVHRIHGEASPLVAAASYDQALRSFFGGSVTGGAPFRSFDLVLLGLGTDGHTASLFPGHAAVRERERWVLAEQVNAVGGWRVTLTPPILNAAANVTFLVAGQAKAEAVRRVLEGRPEPALLPAQAIRPMPGSLTWLLDAAAASRLPAT